MNAICKFFWGKMPGPKNMEIIARKAHLTDVSPSHAKSCDCANYAPVPQGFEMALILAGESRKIKQSFVGTF